MKKLLPLDPFEFFTVMTFKDYEDCFLNGWEVELFDTLEDLQKKYGDVQYNSVYFWPDPVIN